MAISQFYKDNSTERHFHTNDLDFDFKTFNTPITDMTDVSDLTFGISTNEHAFYNDYTFGIPDSKTKFDSGVNVCYNTYNDSADFASTTTTVTYCLVYFPNYHGMPYMQENLGNFEYINFTTGETNINQMCYIVTDFTFDNIILHAKTLSSEWYELYYDAAGNGYKPLATYGNKDDMTKTNNVMNIDVHYWTGDNSYSINDYFSIFAIVTLNDNIIAYKVTDNNIFSTLVTPETSDREETTDFTGVPKFNDNIKKRVIGDKVFNHCINEDNYLQEANFVSNKPTDRDKLGNVIIPKYTGRFQMYYCNIARRDYMLDILAAIGLRFMYVDNTYGVSSQTYNSEISIAYMDEKGVVDWTNIIKGIDNINSSDSYNKNINYDTLPNINYHRDPEPEPEHDGDYTDNILIGGALLKEGNVRYYAMTEYQLEQLFEWMTSEKIKAGENPFEFIRSISVQPYRDPQDREMYANVTKISFGNFSYEGDSVAYRLTMPNNYVNLNEPYTIRRRNEDFSDYAPYCRVKVYIPFCGEIDLPVDIVMGREIQVRFIFDIPRGNCRGLVFCNINGNWCIVGSIEGVYTYEIPMSVEAVGQRRAAELTARLNIAKSIASTAGAVIAMKPYHIAHSTVSILAEDANRAFAENANYIESVGVNGNALSFEMPKQTYLMIDRVVESIPDNFARTHGFMCNKGGKVRDFTGFSKFNAVHIAIEATNAEKDAITRLLERGVILPDTPRN